MTQPADRRFDRELVRLETIRGENPTARVPRRALDGLLNPITVRLSIVPCRIWMARTRVQKSKMSVKRALMPICLVPRLETPSQHAPIRALPSLPLRLLTFLYAKSGDFCP